jgi:Tfp pilus assembly protein PilO
MDLKFTGANKKNIALACVFILITVIFFQFIYFPKYREVKDLDTEYKRIQQDIDELYSFIGKEGNLEDNIIERRKYLVLLEGAFPFEKEMSNIVKELNEEAGRFKINVISLKPKDLFIYKDHEGEELKVSDYFCKCMPLVLRVEARYRALGEFLLSLERNRNPIVFIEELDIERDEDKAPLVRAEIELSAYILGK